ncbi:hypothetical protein CB0940_05441 [Cercospora beticola]|uniref:Uncharacterized protein n=1 Tax=Cercospora beticola TaxID=122368 RepID=A0A2G5I0F4_CERBT|nr:hypothetical protein CB0940_05441 [Cercospora beticola]PIA98284.1 hypothetical protein CB0940_05441 [Cercospora beticola]WPA97986.1 hypothetical protein RHO25_002597 [Cercospora beticola]
MASLHGDNNTPRPGAKIFDIAYSHESTVAAFKSYYEFLAKMYMDPDMIKTPPAAGWVHMTPERMQALGKSEKVITLLRHLPYVHHVLGRPETHSGPACIFADWERKARDLAAHPELTGFDVLCTTEPENVPPHVIGISQGPYKMLLDTQLGLVYWNDCPPAIHEDPSHPIQPIQNDPIDYANDEELGWRCAPAWSIPEFFEVLKHHFVNLDCVPLSRRLVEEGWYGEERDMPDNLGACRVAAEIYRRHGWPDVEKFRKDQCMAELEREIPERFPEQFFL